MEDARERVDLSKLMEAIMMETSKTMLLMAMAYMLAKKAFGSKANGKIMFPMVMERPLTLTSRDTSGNS